jgi:hypothetical protein
MRVSIARVDDTNSPKLFTPKGNSELQKGEEHITAIFPEVFVITLTSPPPAGQSTRTE